jgi:hypothetical protein
LRRFANPRLLYPGIVFLAALILYSWTLAPTVTLVDSGELIVTAHSLGVAHPPGFPLYLMLAHIASVIPIGNIAQRVHFASALFASLGSAMVTAAVIELLETKPISAPRRKPKKKSGRATGVVAIPAASSFVRLTPALGAGLVFLCSRTLWAYATIAEVYTLNTLLIAIVFWLMFRWRRSILENEARERPTTAHDWLLYTASIVFGFALGVHHVTVALTLPALAVLVWKTQGWPFFTSKRLLFAAAVSILALIAVYSYLPWAAARSPLINWGNPRSLSAVWAHITGKQYQVFFSFDPSLIGNQLVEFVSLLLREFGPPWLPFVPVLAIIGFVQLFRRERVIFWFLGLVILADIGYGVSYVIAEDKDAYYLPAFVAFTIAAAFGLRWLFGLAKFKRESVAAPRLTTVLLILIVTACPLVANWSFNNRHQYFIAHDYVENIMRPMERGSLLLTLDWQVASPVLYTREVEHLRPDVKVVDVNLLRRLWYFDYLEHAYPDLVERSREEVDSFVAELKQWEADPQAYARDAILAQRIQSKFQNMLVSLVTREMAVAPVYVTNDAVFQTDERDKELTRWLTSKYQLVPHGLVFKLETGRGFHDPGVPQVETRGLADGTLKFEPDDVVTLKVLPAYKTMLVNRGRYLNLYGHYAEAIEAFGSVLKLDPNLELARKGLGESLAKLPR